MELIPRPLLRLACTIVLADDRLLGLLGAALPDLRIWARAMLSRRVEEMISERRDQDLVELLVRFSEAVPCPPPPSTPSIAGETIVRLRTAVATGAGGSA